MSVVLTKPLLTVGMNCVSIYAVSVNAQLVSPFTARIPRSIWSILITACILLLGLIGRDHLLAVLQNFLSLLGYWETAYFTIVFSEHFFFRGRSLANYDLDAWDTPSRLPIGFAGLGAFLCGAAGWIVGMDETYYVGPLSKMIGSYGGDIGNELALVFTAVSYIPLRKLELMYTGR